MSRHVHQFSLLQGHYGFFLWLILGSVSCGSPQFALPPTLESSANEGIGHAVKGDQSALELRRVVADRTLGRSGLSCADCHDIGTDADQSLRPAVPLILRTASHGDPHATGKAIELCVSRYLLRVPLAKAEVMALSSFLVPALSHAPRATDADGAMLYGSGCRHCHEDGPASNILGRPFSRAYLASMIRGTSRRAHPKTLMPSFNEARLGVAELERLIAFVLYGASSAP